MGGIGCLVGLGFVFYGDWGRWRRGGRERGWDGGGEGENEIGKTRLGKMKDVSVGSWWEEGRGGKLEKGRCKVGLWER